MWRRLFSMRVSGQLWLNWGDGRNNGLFPVRAVDCFLFHRAGSLICCLTLLSWSFYGPSIKSYKAKRRENHASGFVYAASPLSLIWFLLLLRPWKRIIYRVTKGFARTKNWIHRKWSHCNWSWALSCSRIAINSSYCCQRVFVTQALLNLSLDILPGV